MTRRPADRLLIADCGAVRELERGDFLRFLPRLGLELSACDLLIEREFASAEAARLRSLGVEQSSLTGSEVGEAARLRRSDEALSVCDAFACILAAGRGMTLLASGPAILRAAAERQLACRTVAWVLDRLDDAKLCTRTRLRAGLTAMAAHPRCRLSKSDVTRRLQRYSA